MGSRAKVIVFDTFGKDVALSDASCERTEQVFSQNQNIRGYFDYRQHCIISSFLKFLAANSSIEPGYEGPGVCPLVNQPPPLNIHIYCKETLYQSALGYHHLHNSLTWCSVRSKIWWLRRSARQAAHTHTGIYALGRWGGSLTKNIGEVERNNNNREPPRANNHKQNLSYPSVSNVSFHSNYRT